MLPLLFKAITPENISPITGAAREGNPLSGRCSGIWYRGWDCRNVTIHPPDNAFPGSCTKSREREAFVWQQHPRASTGIQEELCMPGGNFPNSFYPLSAESTHGRAAAGLQPVTVRLCSSLRAAPHSFTPALSTSPHNRTPHTPWPSSQAGHYGIIPLLCTAGPGGAPGRRWPELVGSTACPSLVPISFLW